MFSFFIIIMSTIARGIYEDDMNEIERKKMEMNEKQNTILRHLVEASRFLFQL